MSDMDKDRIEEIRQYYATHSAEDEIANAVRDDTPLSPMSGYSVRLPTDLLNRARDLAAERGMTTGAWLREAIETAVAQHGSSEAAPPPAEPEEVARIKALVLKEFEANLKDRVDAYIDLRLGRSPSPYVSGSNLLGSHARPSEMSRLSEVLEKAAEELQSAGRVDTAKLLSDSVAKLSDYRLFVSPSLVELVADYAKNPFGDLRRNFPEPHRWLGRYWGAMDREPPSEASATLPNPSGSATMILLADSDGKHLVQVEWGKDGEITRITPLSVSESGKERTDTR